MREVVIIGAGGHGKVVADIVTLSGDKVRGFLDDDTNVKECAGFPVLGTVNDYKEHIICDFIIAVGNADIRENIAGKLVGAKWYTAIHPTAIVSKVDTCIGEGTVVMPGSIVNAGAKLGKHVIVNSGAIVEHDNKISDFAHISVGAKLGGTVSIGRKTWIGIGSTVSNNVSICDECTVGAGAVVVKDIMEKGVYVGVPAKKR